MRTGSHGVFVAPVRIGDGAYTGAGTVVRKDVPAGRPRHERRPATQHRGLGRRSIDPAPRQPRRPRPPQRHPAPTKTERTGTPRVERTATCRESRPPDQKRLVLVSGRAHPQLAERHRRGARLRARADRCAHLRERRDLRPLRRERPRVRRVRHPVAHLADQRVAHGAAHHGRRAEARVAPSASPSSSPFYPYARQDKKGRGREPISARLVADLYKAAGADRIMSRRPARRADPGLLRRPGRPPVRDAGAARALPRASSTPRRSPSCRPTWAACASPTSGATSSARRSPSSTSAATRSCRTRSRCTRSSATSTAASACSSTTSSTPAAPS